MLYVAGFEHHSVVDGPGVREVVFLQGCSHDCPGCHNPETHPFEGGEPWRPYDLAAYLYAQCIDQNHPAVTISGGDPLQQPETTALCWALKRINEKTSIWVYTGLRWEQALDIPGIEAIDVLVDGPYVESQRTLTTPFVGSRNQRLVDVKASLMAGTTILWKQPVEEMQDDIAGTPLLMWLEKEQKATKGGIGSGRPSYNKKEALPQDNSGADASLAGSGQ